MIGGKRVIVCNDRVQMAGQLAAIGATGTVIRVDNIGYGRQMCMVHWDDGHQHRILSTNVVRIA